MEIQLAHDHDSVDYPLVAGLDTTVGHGADSFFINDAITDPWSGRCLTTIVDTVLNHEKVIFPLWSKAAIQNLQEKMLPIIFSKSVGTDLLSVVSDISAEEVVLPANLIRSEYLIFAEWSKQHINELAGWSRYVLETPRLIHVRKSTPGPWELSEAAWPQKLGSQLAVQTGIPESDLKFSFQVFVRAVQYHKILGDSIPYFAHPIRERALGFLPVLREQKVQWSWGRYFVELFNRNRVPREVDWLLENVSRVRETMRKQQVNWYDLCERPRREQIEVLSGIASESTLPANLKDTTHRAIRIALTASAVVTSGIPVFGFPVIGVVLGLGAVAVEYWNGGIPGKLGKLNAFKGRLVWPGLFNET